MSRNSILAVVAVFMLGIVAIGGAQAFGRWSGNEDREQLVEFFEHNDYEGWKEYNIEQLTEENFEKVRNGFQSRQQHRMQDEAIHDTIESGDYSAYLAALDETEFVPPHLADLTEEEFDLHVLMHQAMLDGDTDTAAELRAKLGFPKRGFGRHGSLGNAIGDCAMS